MKPKSENMEWIEIPGTDSFYSINKNGEVKAKKREWVTGRVIKRVKEEYILSPFLKQNGYFHVTLRIAGKQKQFPIHALIAKVFISNPENKKCVNHIDGNKFNNSIENLEWVTYSENANHALNLGLRVNPSGIDNGYSKPIKAYQKGVLIGIYPSLRAAANSLNIKYDRAFDISKKSVLKTDLTLTRISRDEYNKQTNNELF